MGLFWTLTGLLSFVWCAATLLLMCSLKVQRTCKVLWTYRLFYMPHPSLGFMYC